MNEATKGFRRTLLAAAAEEVRDGNLTRWEMLRIRIACALRPDKLRQSQTVVVDQACAAGLMRDADAESADFDWTALLAFIKELLPLIMQIIAMFSGEDTA